jgi:hypothetical protein
MNIDKSNLNKHYNNEHKDFIAFMPLVTKEQEANFKQVLSGFHRTAEKKTKEQKSEERSKKRKAESAETKRLLNSSKFTTPTAVITLQQLF